MMDFTAIMKMKSAWDTFTNNHPKFMPFLQAVGREAVSYTHLRAHETGA